MAARYELLDAARAVMEILEDEYTAAEQEKIIFLVCEMLNLQLQKKPEPYVDYTR